jgi:hypothetical protein
MYKMSFFRKLMLAIADSALRYAGLEPVYEVRIRKINQTRDTQGVLIKRFDQLNHDLVDKQKAACAGLRADLCAAVDLVVRVHAQPGYVLVATPGVWRPSRMVRRISARAAGTVLTEVASNE